MYQWLDYSSPDLASEEHLDNVLADVLLDPPPPLLDFLGNRCSWHGPTLYERSCGMTAVAWPSARDARLWSRSASIGAPLWAITT